MGHLSAPCLQNTVVTATTSDITAKHMEEAGDWGVPCNHGFHQYAGQINGAAATELILEARGRVDQHCMLGLQDIPNSSSAAAVGGKTSGSLWLLGVEHDLHFLRDTVHDPCKAYFFW